MCAIIAYSSTQHLARANVIEDLVLLFLFLFIFAFFFWNSSTQHLARAS
jgi:hypothetical protein